MPAIVVTDGGGSPRYLKSTGDGSDGTTNVAIPSHIVDSIAGALPAGTNNIGDADIITLVGDNADLDSGAGADDHALVAVGLPAAGGHVVGGTPTNPFRVDPVASTVMPVSVASFYVPINTIATVVGNPQVIASIAGVPNVVASVVGAPTVLASIPNIPGIAIRSQYLALNVVATVVGNPAVIASIAGNPAVVGSVHVSNMLSTIAGINATIFAVVNTAGAVANVVSSTIGTIYAVVNTAAPGGATDVAIQSQYIPLQVTGSVIGTIYAVVNTSAPGVADMAIRSQYIQLTTTASVVGNPAVIASIVGAPSVLASIPNVPSISVASFYVPVNVIATVVGNPQVIASVAGFANVVATIPNVANVAVQSFYITPNVVASQIGNAAVTASVAGFANVVATIPNVPSVGVVSFGPYVRPYTVGSQWSTIARVQASANNAAPVSAKGANVFNYVTQLSVMNAAASYGGQINLQDGTGTIFVGYAAPAGGGFAVNFPAALKPAANATLFIGVPVYSLDLFITISGFQGA